MCVSANIVGVCWRDCAGQGAYFAEKASYSLSYAYTPPHAPHRRVMFLASVLTGHSKNFGTATQMSLKLAPELPPSHPVYSSVDFPGQYDSVQGGPHSGSLMWILYEREHAYPRYCIELGT